STKGFPAERDTLEPEPIEEVEQIAAEVLDPIRAGWDRGSAVTAVVVAKHPEHSGEGFELRVPQRQRQANSMREHEHGRAARPINAVVDVSRRRRGHTPSARDPLPRGAWRLSAASRESECGLALCRPRVGSTPRI